MSILEAFYTPIDGSYKGSRVFFHQNSYSMDNAKYLVDIYPTSLVNTKISVANVKVAWWNKEDESNANIVREYLGIVSLERNMINMYIASKQNANTGKLIERLIALNCTVVEFFLQYMNLLYWKEIKNNIPEEKSGMTLYESQELIMPVASQLSNITNTMLEHEMPQKLVSNILQSTFKSDKLGFQLETDNLKSVITHTKKEKKEKKKKNT